MENVFQERQLTLICSSALSKHFLIVLDGLKSVFRTMSLLPVLQVRPKLAAQRTYNERRTDSNGGTFKGKMLKSGVYFVHVYSQCKRTLNGLKVVTLFFSLHFHASRKKNPLFVSLSIRC